jgi:hypothetical protein
MNKLRLHGGNREEDIWYFAKDAGLATLWW